MKLTDIVKITEDDNKTLALLETDPKWKVFVKLMKFKQLKLMYEAMQANTLEQMCKLQGRSEMIDVLLNDVRNTLVHQERKNDA